MKQYNNLKRNQSQSMDQVKPVLFPACYTVGSVVTHFRSARDRAATSNTTPVMLFTIPSAAARTCKEDRIPEAPEGIDSSMFPCTKVL